MQRPGDQPPAVWEKLLFSKWRFQSVLTIRSKPDGGLEWNGYFLFAHAVHSGAIGFRKLHPRSLLERR